MTDPEILEAALFPDLELELNVEPEGRQRTYALVDAARDPSIYPAVLGADCPWLSLYRGDAAARMAIVAPYLVLLDRKSRFTQWLLRGGWGKSYGVFLMATTSMELLRNHFRRFVMVQLPDGRSVYFRFYDPRVLRVYLPTCTPEEQAAMFGPVEKYVMENEEGDVVEFERDA
jgi:hypothetical protein